MGKGNGLWRDFNSQGLITVRGVQRVTRHSRNVRLASPHLADVLSIRSFWGRQHSVEWLRSSSPGGGGGGVVPIMSQPIHSTLLLDTASSNRLVGPLPISPNGWSLSTSSSWSMAGWPRRRILITTINTVSVNCRSMVSGYSALYWPLQRSMKGRVHGMAPVVIA